jgi:hypothetical protein
MKVRGGTMFGAAALKLARRSISSHRGDEDGRALA